MEKFNKDDKVTISTNVLKIYGVSQDHVFSVVNTDKDGYVKLNNGWYIDPKYLIKNPTNSITDGRISINDKELEDLVDSKLDQLVGAGQMFTSYDVTKQLREDNPILNIIHEKVKEIVENIYNSNYNLTRSLINIATPNPWLYHDYYQDPNDYVAKQTPLPEKNSGNRILKMSFNFK